MNLNKYNFIWGFQGSGKTTLMEKILNSLGGKTLYFSIDGKIDIKNGIHFYNFYELLEILKEISEIDDPINVVIESLAYEYIEEIPIYLLKKENIRYFFTGNINHSPNQGIIGHHLDVVAKFIQGQRLPNNQFSWFEVSKMRDMRLDNVSILVCDLTSNETYDVMDIPAIFRSKKINSILV